MGNSLLRDEKNIAILRELLKNPRISIRSISKKLGLNYLTARRKIATLTKKYGISLGVLVPAEIAGREVAFVRMKIDSSNSISALMINCARVSIIAKVNNGNEIIVVIRGKSKQEILRVAEFLRTLVGGVKEFTIEYGTLTHNLPIALCNVHGYCSGPNGNSMRDCLSCITGANN